MSRFTEWAATNELRFAVPDCTTTEPARLQQKWVRRMQSEEGMIVRHDWRDVPRVVIPREHWTTELARAAGHD